jgi:hypothetical protein
MTQIDVIFDVYFLIHRPLALNRILPIMFLFLGPPRPYLSPMVTSRGGNLILNRISNSVDRPVIEKFDEKYRYFGFFGWFNRRFILECEEQWFDPSSEPFEGPFKMPTKMKI